MAHFEITIDSPLSAPDAWARILDLRAHSVVIPLTTVTGETLDAAGLAPGSSFNARTAVGPAGFDDPMVFDEVVQPTETAAGQARIRKEGTLIRGQITLTVTPRPGGSAVVWSQDIAVNHVPSLADPVVALVARGAYGSTLKKLLARA
ncbi:MAG: SRPBCC family protein [Terracoccus sp.]